MASDSVQGRKIAVTGHGFDVTENDIRTIFERFGEIQEVIYIRNKDTGKSKGFSFVVYCDHASAQHAISAMHHDFIFGRRVSVEFARQHKIDDSFTYNYSPSLPKQAPFHHPHGLSPEPYRPMRRPQPNDFYHPRPPPDSRHPFPHGYPSSRSDMNHSPPARFHSPGVRSEAFPKEKSQEVIQEPEAPHPLATPSSLSGTSEQEDGEIPSGPDRKLLEPLEDGEMPDSGTPTQRIGESSEEANFRPLRTDRPRPFSLSNWKIDADTEKLLENIIRIQGSINIDSNEAQRVWAQGGLRKLKEPSPPPELDPKLSNPTPEQLSPVKGEHIRRELDLPSYAHMSSELKQGRSQEQPLPKDSGWDLNSGAPVDFPYQEGASAKHLPLEGQRMLGHPLHEGRDWAPPPGPRYRPDLRPVLGPDSHMPDQNSGNYGYNVPQFQRQLQEPPSRPPFSHPPPSRHAHFPMRHPGPDSHYQSFPHQHVMPMRGHPSQRPYMSGPGLHPAQEMMQSAPPMMEQPQGSYDHMHQHPPADNYSYPPMPMQDHNSGSFPGYSMQYPGGNNSTPIDQGVGMHDHSMLPHAMGHQQPMDIPVQLVGNDGGANFQISPATIAQATIAQAAVNSDQSQDLSRSKDPMTLMSRMYVGNLDPKQVTKEDLHDTFSVYGRILDIKIHNHFAFIQFDNPFSCMDAIHTAHSNTIQGQQPKLQLAADGQRARNDMISSGNTSSLPPDSKELPLNVPYPNPFRGQSGQLPTFLTVQPQQQPMEAPTAPQPTFVPTTSVQVPTGVTQSQQPILPAQNVPPATNVGPQPIQASVNQLQQTNNEASNAQINAQLLSTYLGMDPTALAAILSSLPMLAKAKEEASGEAKASPAVSLRSNALDAINLASNKKVRSEKESKKRKKKEVEKHAKTKKLHQMEAKKQKARKKEEELAKVRARLTREITESKETKSKDKSKQKSDSRQESKRSKHSEEVYKKISKPESSNTKERSKQPPDSKSHVEPTASRDKEEKLPESKEEKPLTEKKEKLPSDKLRHKAKLPHKTRHESKSHKKPHSPTHSKSRKRSHDSDSPASGKEFTTKEDDMMDHYAYLYDMMTQNPMNKLMKDYHDYYVGIYGYNFSHWSTEYERFLEDYPMDEDTKEMLDLMQSYQGNPYFYGSSMGSGPTPLSESDKAREIDWPSSSLDQNKKVKTSNESMDVDTSQNPKL